MQRKSDEKTLLINNVFENPAAIIGKGTYLFLVILKEQKRIQLLFCLGGEWSVRPHGT